VTRFDTYYYRPWLMELIEEVRRRVIERARERARLHRASTTNRFEDIEVFLDEYESGMREALTSIPFFNPFRYDDIDYPIDYIVDKRSRRYSLLEELGLLGFE